LRWGSGKSLVRFRGIPGFEFSYWVRVRQWKRECTWESESWPGMIAGGFVSAMKIDGGGGGVPRMDARFQ